MLGPTRFELNSDTGDLTLDGLVFPSLSLYIGWQPAGPRAAGQRNSEIQGRGPYGRASGSWALGPLDRLQLLRNGFITVL